MPVDARAAVPARVWLSAVVDPHNQYILRTVLEVQRQINDKAGVTIRVQCYQLTVDRYFGVHINTFKLDLHALPAPFSRDQEFFPIGDQSTPGITTAAASGVTLVARFVDREIVRQVHRLPLSEGR